MRFFPILTAILVAAALYGVILERDALRAWANSEPGEAATVEDEAETTPQAGDDPVSVVVLKSEARQVQSGISLSGRTEAARKVDVRAEVTGLVISDPIRKGQRIERGDLLCQIDIGTREAMLTQADAKLREAENNLRTASQLAQRGFSSETDTISREAALESAKAEVEQARKELERIEIRAPFSGILETDTAELGSLLQPGSPCATLISLDPIKLVGFVPEQDVERLELGSPAGARLITGQVLSGQVSFLSRSADAETRTFRVEIEVSNPDFSIRDGVTAEIQIGLTGETGHLIPQSALTLDDTGRLGIRSNDDGKAKFLPVTLIRDDPNGVWVGGLPDEVEIIVVGQDFVTDGRDIDVAYRGQDG